MVDGSTAHKRWQSKRFQRSLFLLLHRNAKALEHKLRLEISPVDTERWAHTSLKHSVGKSSSFIVVVAPTNYLPFPPNLAASLELLGITQRVSLMLVERRQQPHSRRRGLVPDKRAVAPRLNDCFVFHLSHATTIRILQQSARHVTKIPIFTQRPQLGLMQRVENCLSGCG